MFILCYEPDVSDYLVKKGFLLMSQPDTTPFIYAFHPSQAEALNEISGRYLMTHQLLF